MSGRPGRLARIAGVLALIVPPAVIYLLLVDWACGREDFLLAPRRGPVVVLPAPGAARVAAAMGPKRLRGRLTASVDGLSLPLSWSADRPAELETELPALETGLHFVGYRAEYMGGRAREAVLPVAVGPFAGEGQWLERAVALTLPQHLLWRAEPGSSTLSRVLGDLVQDLVARELERPGFEPPIGAVEVPDLRIEARDGRLIISVRLLLDGDGAISVSGPIAFDLDAAGGLKPSGGPYEVGVDLGETLLSAIRESGRDEGASLGEAAGAFAGSTGRMVGGLIGGAIGSAVASGIAEQRVRDEVERVIEERVLPLLEDALRLERPVFLAGDSDLGLELRWSRAPVLEAGRGALLEFDARPVGGGGPTAGPGLPGAPLTGRPAPRPERGDTAAMSVSLDLVNRIAFSAWETGLIDGALSAPRTVAGLNRELAALTVAIEDIRLALPPVLRADGGGLATLIELSLTDGRRSLDARAALTSAVGFSGDGRELWIEPRTFSVSCLDGGGLRACYPDLARLVSVDPAFLEGLVLGIGDRLDRLGDLGLSLGGEGGVTVTFSGTDPLLVPGGLIVGLRPELI